MNTCNFLYGSGHLCLILLLAHDRMICWETMVLTWGRLFYLLADICE